MEFYVKGFVMTIYDFDNDFAHYEVDEETQKSLGQVWTPFHIIEQMMDKAGTIDDKSSIWYDETKTNLDPTMGAGNIVIAMLYRRIVQCDQNPVVALSNVYGVELDNSTLNFARKRIVNFMHKISENLNIKIDFEKVNELVYEKNSFTNNPNPNFVCSDIFKWDIVNWKPKKSEIEEQTDVWHSLGVKV